MPFSYEQRAWFQELTGGGAAPGGAPGGAPGRGSGRPPDDDEAPPPTPMALPVEKPGKKTKPQGVQMEPLSLDPKTANPADRQALHDAKSTAKKDFDAENEKKSADQFILVEQVISRSDGLQANYGVMVHGACLLFQGYAKKKLDDIKGKPDPYEMLGPILGIGLGILFAELVPLIAASELGKHVVEKVLDGVKEQVVKAAERALKQDLKSLEAGVDVIVAQSVIEDEYQEALNKARAVMRAAEEAIKFA